VLFDVHRPEHGWLDLTDIAEHPRYVIVPQDCRRTRRGEHIVGLLEFRQVLTRLPNSGAKSRRFRSRLWSIIRNCKEFDRRTGAFIFWAYCDRSIRSSVAKFVEVVADELLLVGNIFRAVLASVITEWKVLGYYTDFRWPIAWHAEFDSARPTRGTAVEGTFVNISSLSKRLPGEKDNREVCKEKKPTLRAGSGGNQSFHTSSRV
jgi:hypothetical protein